ncbi:MAG: DUF5615 family PIN-like protein [Promethearchaeota archaeon]
MKFLTDSMFGRLTRFLRIFGYDTIYANELEDYFNLKPVPDENLLDFALKDNRIIITKDYRFYKKSINNSVYLEGKGIYNYLNQLKMKLGLTFNFNIKYARCSICNAELEKVENKNLIKEDVQEETFKYHDNFYRCKNSNCKKIYWKGTHIENILNNIHKKKT